ncbi:MAG: 50S ribosomal protein L3 [Candidatus Methylacidiphilales bacterium]|nr:50S ribosomal protein L3 [Candidatus Methylacidiphilales bacterium]
MSIGILGKKVGMTRVYDQSGTSVAVTVIEAGNNVVTQVRTSEKDGYTAVQLGFGETTEKRTTKPLAGHFKKAGTAPKKFVREFALPAEAECKVGDVMGVTRFQPGQLIDVIGVSKGKGFQGVVKRYRFGGQPETHGSMMHRRTGAIGCRSTPGRVFKNQKMPGHMGDKKITIQNLEVVGVREEDQVLLIRGAVPGANGSYVIIRDAVKGQKKTNGKS